MAFLTGRVVFYIFFFLPIFVDRTMNALIYKGLNVLVRELLFARRLNYMALDEAIDFLGLFVRDLLDLGMTAFTFDLCVNAIVEYVLIYIKEFHHAFFIDTAYALILMTEEAVAHIC